MRASMQPTITSCRCGSAVRCARSKLFLEYARLCSTMRSIKDIGLNINQTNVGRICAEKLGAVGRLLGLRFQDRQVAAIEQVLDQLDAVIDKAVLPLFDGYHLGLAG